MGAVTSKIVGWKPDDIQEDINRINDKYSNNEQVVVSEDIVTDDPGGDNRSISSGSRTPSSAAGLTPSGSPSQRNGGRLATPVKSGRSSHSPSPSRTLFNENKPRKLSAVEAMKAKILVKTGDQEKSGTNANVFVQLEDEKGVKTSVVKLDQLFRDDLERGKLDDFSIQLPEGMAIGEIK